MKHQYKELDDFNDTGRPPLIDWVELGLQVIFITAGAVMFFYIGWLFMQTVWGCGLL